MSGIPYRFLPWVRRGLARSYAQQDQGEATLAARPKVSVGLILQAREDGNPVANVSGKIELSLYGPEDIIGMDSRLVVRTDPKPNVTNFEPNHLALVDFDPPDFPWMLTPARANDSNNLRPWIALVVLEQKQVGLPQAWPGRPLPSIQLTTRQVKSELPDLRESWCWAHGQAVSATTDLRTLENELLQSPARNISRLVCPRRLRPDTAYVACVVPAFAVGRARGLGQTTSPEDLTPAWDLAHPNDCELPIYYYWQFSTGPVGDVESLARRLKTPQKYKDDKALIAKLNDIGELPVSVDADRLLVAPEGGTSPTPLRTTKFEGALLSLDYEPNPQDRDFQKTKKMFAKHLEIILNSGQKHALTGKGKENKVPTLSAPIYGEHPAKRHVVESKNISADWLDELNLQPRYRLAAGWGAEVVRRNQDEFMQAAWEQMGDVLAAERAFSLSRLSYDVLRVIADRHLSRLEESRFLTVLGPMRARVKVSSEQSLYGRIGQATLPDELFGGAMRRFASPRRQTLRMAQWRQHSTVESIPLQVRNLVKQFANAVENRAAIDPNRFVPDGLTGSRSFDKIPIPSDRRKLVDLAPYTGLPGTMTAGEIKAMQRTARTDKARAAKAKPAVPQIPNVRRDGLLTETHELRLLELRRASPEPVDESELAAQIKKTSLRSADTVLLSVGRGGRVTAQALSVDQNTGFVRNAGRAFSGRASRMSAAGRAIAEVSPQALRLHGPGLVMNRLPVGALGGLGAPARISVDPVGRFAPVSPPTPAAGVTTITLPPTVRAPEVINRYTKAFKDYQRLWKQTVEPARDVLVPVDFGVAQSARDARSRIRPERTVPVRLASTLVLGAQAVTWDSRKGLRNPFVSARLDLATAERLRYVIPLAFDRVMAYPKLPLPLAKKLEILAPEVFLPGVGDLPDDFIMAVKTNPRFVEALLLGANVEMCRELLWQGFPTDQRGTPFQHFWRRMDGGFDIEPIHSWQHVPLGKQPASSEMLVLLIRGQLLERFPNISIYAYPMVRGATRPGGTIQPHSGEMDPALIEVPILRGHLGKDITYVGFDAKKIPATEAGMQKWFFVLEEQMTEPRFGFDEPNGAAGVPGSWQDADWNDVGVGAGSYFGTAQLRSTGLANTPVWTHPHGARIASALLQMPFRGFYAGIKLVPPKV